MARPGTAAPSTLSPPARRLGIAVALLIASSVVGGAVSVQVGVNTWAEAWSSTATLASPWPMVLVQATAGLLAVVGRRPWALGGTVLLLLGATASVVSGFFDGQLAKDGLSDGYIALQSGFVAVAVTVVVLAALRLRQLLRAVQHRSHPERDPIRDTMTSAAEGQRRRRSGFASRDKRWPGRAKIQR